MTGGGKDLTFVAVKRLKNSPKAAEDTSNNKSKQGDREESRNFSHTKNMRLSIEMMRDKGPAKHHV